MKALNILHLTLCVGSLLFMVIFYFAVSQNNVKSFSRPLEISEMIPLGIAAAFLFIANIIYRKKIASVDLQNLTAENFPQFRQAHILKWAIINNAILVNLVFYFFVSNHPALIFTAIALLLYLYLNRLRY